MKIKCSSLLIFSLFCSALCHAQTNLTVEVVDDREDAGKHPAYIMILGEAFSGVANNAAMSISGNPAPPSINLLAPSPTAPALVTSLQTSRSIISPYTGKSRPVYSFTVASVSSGNIYFFKNYGGGSPPFTFTTNASGGLVVPDPTTANFRYDFCEFSFNPAVPSVVDLTTIDQFAMPMQLETYKGPSTALTKVDELTYYASTKSMLHEFQNLGSSMTNAIYKFNKAPGTVKPLPGWSTANGLTNFVRVMGPGKLASINNGQTAPYPSFSSYLSALAASDYQFQVSGTSCGYQYNYTGQVKSVKHGYKLKLDGTLTGTPNLNAGATVTMHLPTVNTATATATVNSNGQVTAVTPTANLGYGYMGNAPTVTIGGPPGTGNTTATAKAMVNSDGEVTGYKMISGGSGYNSQSPPPVTVDAPAGSMDTFLYGCTLSSDAVAVSGWSNAQVDATSNTPFSTVVGDASAAINFGYLSGRHPNSGASWYTQYIPTCIPFGGARNSPDDGFYSAWAAWVYNNCDSYGFAFGDRNGRPPVTINIAPNSKTYDTTLRITLLPDERLDAPQNIRTKSAQNSIEFSWAKASPWSPPMTGVLLKVLSTTNIAPITVTQNPYTLNGLQPGTPYTFALSHLGNANGKQVRSPDQFVQATTSGDLIPYMPTAANSMTFDFALAGWTINPLNPTWGTSAGLGSTMKINDQKLYYAPATSNWLSSAGKNATLWAQGGTNNYVVNIMDPDGHTRYSSIFTAIFATNHQATATVQATSGGAPANVLTNLTLTYGGSGYDTQCPPVVAFIGGDDPGAASTVATISKGAITSLKLVNVGCNYENPIAVISSTYAVKKAKLYGSSGAVTPCPLPAGTKYYGSTNLMASYLTLPVTFIPTASKVFYPITVAPLGSSGSDEKSHKGWAQPKGTWLPSDMGSWYSSDKDK